MRKPPRVSPAAKDAALARIHRRHARDDNSYTYLLSEDPREVLAYLRKRGPQGLVGDAESHDVEDALDLRVWLWWEGEDNELWLLDAVDTLGLNRRRVGAHLGVGTSTGLVDRREYKRKLLQPDPDPAYSEANPAPPTAGPTPQQRWLAAHDQAIHAIATTLVEHWHLAGDDPDVDESLVEVRRDLGLHPYTPGAFTVIGWAVDELAALPTIGALPTTHPLRQALAAWPPLASAYAALPGRKTPA
ncbi:MAG TPA: hypothetical protein VJT31_26760 [Rugosimonospora sp.]|nr:hypothetical protein [Rugosimonospora sp.]